MVRQQSKRYTAFFVVGILIVLYSCKQQQNYTEASLEEAQRPNIIFVLADDQGYGDMSFYGNNVLKTPNMDRLAQESVRLNNFYMNTVCAPSRASLMTGRYNQRTGVWDTWKGRTSMHGDEYTVAEALRDGGYTTGLFGKWHLGYNTPLRPIDQGFETTLEFEEYVKDSATRVNPVMKVNGELKQFDGFLSDVVFDGAMDWIEKQAKAEKPFFAYVASFLPHDSDKPQVMPEYVEPFSENDTLSPATKEVYGMVAKLDEKLGQLLNKVDELGIADNTVIIYSSDNGAQYSDRPYRYNYGLRGQKTQIFEGGIKVPCFFKWPNVLKADHEVEALAAHIDIMPTLLDVCGIELPQNIKIDGISLLSYLKDEKAPEDRALFFQFQRAAVPSLWGNTAMIKNGFKLITDSLLFNLSADPGESVNLIDEFASVAEDMRQEVKDWFADVSATRGYSTSPVILGTPAQTLTTLQFWNRNENGWPMNVEHEGPYRITVQNVEPRLFPNGADLVLQFGGSGFSLPIQNGNEELVFENIKLKKGDYYFNMWTEGEKKPEKGRWNQENLGYKNVIIELLSPRFN